MEQQEEDRISKLPDPILLQILSLIDINQAIQTMILSTRWKNLCFSLSDLHFDLSRAAAHAGVNLKNRQTAQAFSLQFSPFVSHFLSHRDAATAVRSFRLSFNSHLVHVDAEFVERCAIYAVNHGVESLHLQALCRPALRLPAAFFSSKSLRELKLSQLSYGIYIPPKDFSFPNLKTLDLEESVFIDNDRSYSFSKEPFSGFPALENLTLRRSITLYGLVISAPKLRFLEIIQDKLYSEAMEEISAPLLTSFRYEGYFPLECSSVNLPMLEEVYVDIHKKAVTNKRLNQKRMALKCVSLLQQLRNAKTVALTLDTLKVLEMGGGVIEQSPSPFPYMRCLKLRKGRGEMQTVVKRVMEYLTEGSLYSDTMVVELPRGVSVVEMSSEELFDQGREEQRVFGVEDETSSFRIKNFECFKSFLRPNLERMVDLSSKLNLNAYKRIIDFKRLNNILLPFLLLLLFLSLVFKFVLYFVANYYTCLVKIV